MNLVKYYRGMKRDATKIEKYRLYLIYHTNSFDGFWRCNDIQCQHGLCPSGNGYHELPLFEKTADVGDNGIHCHVFFYHISISSPAADDKDDCLSNGHAARGIVLFW